MTVAATRTFGTLPTVTNSPYLITATYVGDDNFTGSTDTDSLTVTKADTSAAIVTPIAVASCGDATATVGVRVANDSNNAALTGGTVTVTIRQGAAVIGSASSGAVVGADPVTVYVAVPLGGALPGTYGAAATYSGDGNFQASSAPPQPLTIVKTNTTATVQAVSATYGDAAVALTATVASANGAALTGGTVTFVVKQGGVTLATVTSGAVTGASPATATATLALDAGYTAGNYSVEASYGGDACFNPSSGSGTLTVKRRIIWVKPTDRTVGFQQPNPPATPPADCLASQSPPAACWLALVNGSSLAYADDWGDLGVFRSTGGLRFLYARSWPGSNSTEYVGKTYRISASGLTSPNYDIRYAVGTLTVVP